jgi:hypothetical protein
MISDNPSHNSTHETTRNQTRAVNKAPLLWTPLIHSYCRPDFRRPQTGNTAGFSLHAGVATQAHERDKLERLCRYIARPAVSNQRLSLTRNGQVRYQLKTPYTEGTTHVLFEPLDFIARLVALVPRPRVNLTRFHGVFAPYADIGIMHPTVSIES